LKTQGNLEIYHVLGRKKISPIDGVRPESVKDSTLVRKSDQNVKGSDFCPSSTMEGELQIFYIYKP
jgi:recombinational DNA repair protein RecR